MSRGKRTNSFCIMGKCFKVVCDENGTKTKGRYRLRLCYSCCFSSKICFFFIDYKCVFTLLHTHFELSFFGRDVLLPQNMGHNSLKEIELKIPYRSVGPYNTSNSL